MSLVWFLVILFVVGAAGYFVITQFNLGQTALRVFGGVLILALVIWFLYAVLGAAPLPPAGPAPRGWIG